MPPERVRRLRRQYRAIESCDAVVSYLQSRRLWPLPVGCLLKAHPAFEYWDEGHKLGRYPVLIADVTDFEGRPVTCHVTYVPGGQKLENLKPRKFLSPMIGRAACAARIMPATATLGIAEGIETALSAALLDGLPVWAALNTSLLSRFEPPLDVLLLRVYADRDLAGLMAASKLQERLQGRVRVEVRVPEHPANDWNDVLKSAASKQREPKICSAKSK
jgi:putative DNA primase/helicase